MGSATRRRAPARRASTERGWQVERYTPRRQAQFLLQNAVDASDYAIARREVRKLGLDPNTIPHDKPAAR